MAYAAYGDPEGVPVVVFHGTPGSRVLGRLYDEPGRDAGVRVLAFDRPGYGDSPHREDYGPADAPDLVASVLADADIDDAGLLAFSGGAPHALATAAEYPDRVRGVSVVSGAVPPEHRDETPGVQALLATLAARTPRLLGGLLRGQAWAARHLPPSFVTAQYTTDEAEDVPGDAADVVREDFVAALAGDAGGAVAECRAFDDDWPVAPAEVDAPVQWWHGEYDENAPANGAASVVAALPNGAFTRVGDADHLGALVRTRAAALAHAARPGN